MHEREPTRPAASIAGSLLIIGVALGIATPLVLGSTLDGRDPLRVIAAHASRMELVVLLQFLTAVGAAAIPIVLYPVLSRTHPAFAAAAVSMRTLEAAFYGVSGLALVSLVLLAREPGIGDRDGLVVAVIGAFHASTFILGVWSFCVGATFYYLAFLRLKLVPAWLSLWGLLGIGCLLVASLLALFSSRGYTIAGSQRILAAPIATQELVLGGWLLVKGLG
jgi:hypothetical protein